MRSCKRGVTVVIPTFGRRSELLRAVDSVLRQSFSGLIEIVVVDDNGRGTKNQLANESALCAIREPARRRIKYCLHEFNKGGGAARNTGMRKATQYYLTFLDDDDYFYPQKLELQIAVMEKDSSVIACYTGLERCLEGQLIDVSSDCKSGDLYLSALKNELYINAGSNLLMARHTALEVGGYDEDLIRMQDIDYFIRLASLRKNIVCIEDIQLRITLDDRTNVPSYERYSKAVEMFVRKHRDLLQALPPDDAKDVIMSRGLDLVRVAVYQKKWARIPLDINKYNIKLSVLIRYSFYLIRRYRKRKLSGFKFG